MAGPSQLPDLPLFFGNDSPFPPMATPRQVSGGSQFHSQSSQQPKLNPNAPPLPPSRNEALQREQQFRRQQAAQQFHNQQRPPPPQPGHPQYGNSPGMLMSRPQHMAPPVQPMPQSHMAAGPGRSITPRPQTMNAQPLSPKMNHPPPPHQQPFAPAQYAQSRPLPVPSTTPHRALSPAPQSNTLSSSLNSMHLDNSRSQPAPPPPRQRQHSDHGSIQQQPATTRDSISSASGSNFDPSSLNVILPDLDELTRRRDIAFASQDERQKAAWCKEVFKYVERKLDASRISDPALIQLIDQAINVINRAANSQPPIADALYLRGDLLASGSFPSYHPKDLRAAFNDFELSARMGYAPSWFRIGRDYEVLGDMTRSRDAYERGCSVQDIGCIYRMGMANLLGQLELGADHSRAIPLLKEAADLANLDSPQPSYVFGMLLAGEFSHVKVSTELLDSAVDPKKRNQPGSREHEARRRIQRAAYLNFAPAQYRMGWLHEYAQLECPFDPLLSVQYYSLASQGGEVEADLALSKWFLCGAENCFDKNESLAFTFADKAAAKGLPTAEFAMAYYFEIGVGCEKDLDVARKWYKRAASHGNKDAQDRLDALAGPEPNALSRTQHEAHIDTKLQRKRTEAKMLSDRRSQVSSAKGQSVKPPSMPQPQTTPASNTPGLTQQPPIQQRPTQPPSRDLRRKQTMRMVEEVVANRIPMPVPESRGTTPAPSSGYNSTAASTPPVNASSNRPNNAVRPARPPPGKLPMPNQMPVPSVPGPPRRGSGTPQPVRPSQAPGTGSSPQKPTNFNTSAPPTKANIPVKSSGTMGPDTKVYETFGEMGFASQSTKDDKDCVIC
ncbi:hypothetical protein L7F22_019160 [Adiantum nelumboides]|nr:hypothetical protein [Adiantum nelumboides]